MEMFTASQQPALDERVAGRLDEKGFLRTSKWYRNWDMDFSYYRELLAFDGKLLEESHDLIGAVRKKQPGEKGVLLERQGEGLQVEALFDSAVQAPHGDRR